MARLWRLSLVASLSAVVATAGARAAGYDDQQKPIASSGSSVGKNPFNEEFSKFAQKQLDEWKVPGVAIAVIDGDEIHAEGYGFATLPDVKATPETLWYGASTTKAQTAALLASLIDSKNYSALSGGWSTPISSILRDDFVLQDEWATNHITLEDAVSHRTGMARHDKSSLREVDGKAVTPKDVVRNLRNLPMTAEPRVKFYYCNLMFITLSHVIETITGQWLGDSLKELIWGPLGMKSTYFDLEDALDAPEHMASGYLWDVKEKKYREVPFMSVKEVSGAGAVISNVLDYAKWVKCLLHEAAPFSAAVHEDIQTPRMISDAGPGFGVDTMLYGLGWVRTLLYGHILYTHSGGMHAYGAQVYWLPEINFGVVAFANTATTSNAVQEILGWKLMGDKLGIPEGDRYDVSIKWKSILKKMSHDSENAVDVLYPDRPSPALPSTLAPSELAGTYYNAGYGNLTLHLEPHPDRSGKKILVAHRPETTWRYTMKFHHVSGDYWIIYLTLGEYGGLLDEFVAGEFKVGVDGKASGLEIEWANRSDGEYEGKVLFERVE